MTDPSLRELLEQLHGEVESLERSDTETKNRLNNLILDLEKTIDRPVDAEHHENVVQDLRESIRQLEVEHPRTTGILNHIMMTLSNMGI